MIDQSIISEQSGERGGFVKRHTHRASVCVSRIANHMVSLPCPCTRRYALQRSIHTWMGGSRRHTLTPPRLKQYDGAAGVPRRGGGGGLPSVSVVCLLRHEPQGWPLIYGHKCTLDALQRPGEMAHEALCCACTEKSTHTDTQLHQAHD